MTLFQDYSTQEYTIETHQNCPKTKTKKKKEKKKTTVQDSEHNNNNNDIEIVENYYPTLNLCLLQTHKSFFCQTNGFNFATNGVHSRPVSFKTQKEKNPPQKNHKICRGVSSASVFLLREGHSRP